MTEEKDRERAKKVGDFQGDFVNKNKLIVGLIILLFLIIIFTWLLMIAAGACC